MTTTLVKHAQTAIEYTSAAGVKSSRTIVPTHIPSPNVKALDVTAVSDDDKIELQHRLQQYTSYTDSIVEQMKTFEQWLKLTHEKIPIEGLKWRTFKLENITVIE